MGKQLAIPKCKTTAKATEMLAHGYCCSPYHPTHHLICLEAAG